MKMEEEQARGREVCRKLRLLSRAIERRAQFTHSAVRSWATCRRMAPSRRGRPIAHHRRDSSPHLLAMRDRGIRRHSKGSNSVDGPTRRTSCTSVSPTPTNSSLASPFDRALCSTARLGSHTQQASITYWTPACSHDAAPKPRSGSVPARRHLSSERHDRSSRLFSGLHLVYRVSLVLALSQK